MRIALTGASGLVGRSILPVLRAADHELVPLDRSNGYYLGDAPDLFGFDALIHGAFAHAPGRYRGGEGDNPEAFRRANLDGTIRLFDAAAACGVARIIFLSSRAVHDGYPRGMLLTDDLPARPANLYGEIKAGAERHLIDLRAAGVMGTSVRATGVYAEGPHHKWRDLFAKHLAGEAVEPRVGTELHGADLGSAIALLLQTPLPPATVNASDLILDRHDLLAEVSALTGCPTAPPERADAAAMRLPSCAALARLGWRPGGMERLRATLPRLLDPRRDL